MTEADDVDHHAQHPAPPHRRPEHRRPGTCPTGVQGAGRANCARPFAAALVAGCLALPWGARAAPPTNAAGSSGSSPAVEAAPASDAVTRTAPATQPGPGASLFEDPRLDGYVREALTNSPVMEAELQQLLVRRMELKNRRAQRLPSLDLEARYTRTEGGRAIEFPAGQLFNPVFETLNRLLEAQGEPPAFTPNVQDFSDPILRPHEQDTRLRLSAPLYAPELRAAIDASAAQMAVQETALQASARVLVREVQRAYFDAARAVAGEDILRASRDLLAEDLRVAEVQLREGIVTRDRSLRARAEWLGAEQRLDAARARSHQARKRLAQLMGRDSDAELVLPDPEVVDTPVPPPLEPLPPPDSVANRPELLQIDNAMDAARAQARAAAARSLPQLSLGADYGVEGTNYRVDADDDFVTASLMLRWNLFDFGARRAERDAANARRARLQAEREDLARRLKLALEVARDDYALAHRALATAQARLEAAEEAFAIARRRRDEAALGQLAFMDAERALTEARLGVAIAHFDLRDQFAELQFVAADYPLPPLPASARPGHAHDQR